MDDRSVYTPVRSRPEDLGDSTARAERLAGHRPQRLPCSGVTSMFTDVASEMVTSVIPLYLTMAFGFSLVQFGAFDGLYQGMAAITGLWSALIADRRRRHKEVAVVGYSMSAVSRLGLVMAQAVGAASSAFLYVDRLGKGIRTAPRDALISLSSTKARLGESFGVHRALDTAGAVAGPIVASLILSRNVHGLPLGVRVQLLRLVHRARRAGVLRPQQAGGGHARPRLGERGRPREPGPVARERSDRTDRPTSRCAPPSRCSRDRRFAAVVAVAVILALVVPGDAVLFITYSRQADLAAGPVPPPVRRGLGRLPAARRAPGPAGRPRRPRARLPRRRGHAVRRVRPAGRRPRPGWPPSC